MHGHELGVAALEEVLTAEAGPRREAHRAEHTVDVHVADALVHVVGAGAHLARSCRGPCPTPRADATRDRVQPEARDLVALDQPRRRCRRRLRDHRGYVVAVLGREVIQEEVAHRRRLDEVVVDAHQDQVFELHRFPLGALLHGAADLGAVQERTAVRPSGQPAPASVSGGQVRSCNAPEAVRIRWSSRCTWRQRNAT